MVHAALERSIPFSICQIMPGSAKTYQNSSVAGLAVHRPGGESKSV